MNYLKLFENFINSDKDFEKIKRGEFVRFRFGGESGDRRKEFTQDEVNRIDNFLFSNGYKEDNRTKISDEEDFDREYYIKIDNIKYQFIVIKLSDDWYLITKIKWKVNKSSSAWSGEENYKCDGWVGLLKCLKYLKNKIL